MLVPVTLKMENQSLRLMDCLTVFIVAVVRNESAKGLDKPFLERERKEPWRVWLQHLLFPRKLMQIR